MSMNYQGCNIYSELQYMFNIFNNFTEDHKFTKWGPWSPCPRTCLMSHEKQEHFTQRQKRQCASLNVDEGLNNGYGMSCPALESNMDLYFKTQTCELPKCKGVYKITVFWRSTIYILTDSNPTIINTSRCYRAYTIKMGRLDQMRCLLWSWYKTKHPILCRSGH